MNGWGRWSSWNCARNWNLTSQRNGICTNQNTNFSGILRYKQIPWFQPDLEIVNKKKRTCRTVDFAVSVDTGLQISWNEKRDKHLNLDSKLKSMEHDGGGDTNYNWCACNNPKGLVRGLVELEIGGRTKNIQTTALLRHIYIVTWSATERREVRSISPTPSSLN